MKPACITGCEVEVPPGHALVSRMDAEGRITWVNPDFLAISGYARDELLGEYLGAECHPDVPRELMEDRWRDLAAGRPWSGVLKNRCRNGDHYWVVEQAAPVFAYGRIVGYLSVRRRALGDQVAAAQDLFGKLREGPARGLAVRHGRTVPAGPWARLAGAWRNRSLAGRLWAILALILVPAVFAALVGGAALSRSTAALEDALAPRQETAAAVRAASEAAYQNRLQAARAKLAMLLGVLAAAVAAVWGGVALTRGIRRPLSEARRACAAMSEGRFETRLDLGRDDEAGRLLQDLARLQVCLACEVHARDEGAEDVAEADSASDPADRLPFGAEYLREAGERTAEGALAARRALVGIEGDAAGLDGIAFRAHILALNAVVAATRAGAAGEELHAFAAEASALDRQLAAARQTLREGLAASLGSIEDVLQAAAESRRLGAVLAGDAVPAEALPAPDALEREPAERPGDPAPEGAAPPQAGAASPGAPKSEKIPPSRPAPRPRRGAPLPKVKPAGGMRRGLDKEWEEF